MKHSFFLFICSIYIPVCLLGQEDPKNFKIGDFIQLYDNDSISICFSCTGTVTYRRCADYIRKGRMDSVNINVSGQFTDYYAAGGKALEAIMINDYLNGEASYYHPNGELKSIGRYKLDKKIGNWSYYYDNKKLEKIIHYVNGQPFVVEYYDINENHKVINGTGEYRGEFKPDKGCSSYLVWGQVIDGKMEGVWTLFDPHLNNKIAEEYYENGAFEKGISKGILSSEYTYTQGNKILLDGYTPNERLILDENLISCPDGRSYSLKLYNGKSLNAEFYPSLSKSLKSKLSKNLKNQWITIGLAINKNNVLFEVNVRSSINDYESESIIFEKLSSMKKWQTIEEAGSTVDTYIFFTILIRDNQIIIPSEYFYRNGLLLK